MLNTQYFSKPRVISSLLLIASVNINAQSSHQSLDELTFVADEFVQSYLKSSDTNTGFDVHIAEPDNRLRLKSCDGEITAFWPYNPTNIRRMPVGVRCNGTIRWKIFLQTKVKQFREVAVVNTAVRAGQVLNASMISKRQIDILSERREVVEQYEHLIGHVFNQNVRPNTPLSTRVLNLPLLIKRGDLLTMTSAGGPINVEAEVEALADGYEHQSIKVKNTRSGKILNATVVRSGRVRKKL